MVKKLLLTSLTLFAYGSSIAGLVPVSSGKNEPNKKYFLKDDGLEKGTFVVYEEIFLTHSIDANYLAVKSSENLSFLFKREKKGKGAWTQGLEDLLLASMKDEAPHHLQIEEDKAPAKKGGAYNYYSLDNMKASQEILMRMNERANALCTKLFGYLYAVVDSEHLNADNLEWHDADEPLNVISLMHSPGSKAVATPAKILFINEGESFVPSLAHKKVDLKTTTLIAAPKKLMDKEQDRIVLVPNVTFKKLWCARNATVEETNLLSASLINQANHAQGASPQDDSRAADEHHRDKHVKGSVMGVSGSDAPPTTAVGH